MTGTLMETYLGRDAGQRVLSGRIVRGIAERIDAVIWFSDLRGFTRITDTAPDQVIPLLNDYSDAIISAIHAHRGQSNGCSKTMRTDLSETLGTMRTGTAKRTKVLSIRLVEAAPQELDADAQWWANSCAIPPEFTRSAIAQTEHRGE